MLSVSPLEPSWSLPVELSVCSLQHCRCGLTAHCSTEDTSAHCREERRNTAAAHCRSLKRGCTRQIETLTQHAFVVISHRPAGRCVRGSLSRSLSAISNHRPVGRGGEERTRSSACSHEGNSRGSTASWVSLIHCCSGLSASQTHRPVGRCGEDRERAHLTDPGPSLLSAVQRHCPWRVHLHGWHMRRDPLVTAHGGSTLPL